MASSSYSLSKTKRFDVFLSFRGEDTRRGFVSHLEKELERKAINTFKDDEKLQAGDRISDELSRAIENSKFAVVVISKNYASSGWCLNELEKIIKCGEKGILTIVPIFYEVNPSDMRYQKGTFAEAFEKHNARQSPHKVQKWRDALKKVASLSGKGSRTSPSEAALISEIVEDISWRLFSMIPKDGIFGMDTHLKALDPLLNMGSDDEVRMIGIWGMGGIGKTTIAEYLYSILKYRYQFHCFMNNIKKTYSEKGKENLQRQFLSQILHDDKFLSHTGKIDSEMIESKLFDKKVLAILDDVNDSRQLEALAKCTSWFGVGSRVIITARDKALFTMHDIKLVYEVKCLGDDTALVLFKHFAFGYAYIEKQLSDAIRRLSDVVLKLVKGHPLAIKVLGKALRWSDVSEWEVIIGRLAKTPHESIMECMEVSYDGLNDQDKATFLLIGCFFSKENLCRLLQLLNDEGYDVWKSLNTLANKALVNISKNEEVTMHDLIQDVAKEIVRRQSDNVPGRQRFLWDSEDILRVLVDGTGTDAIQGISLDMSEIPYFPRRGFKNMRNLKFLVIRNTSLYKGDLSQMRAAIDHLPPRLKLLDWPHCPLKTLPSTFDANCLVELRLPHSHLEKLSEKSLPLGKLRMIKFRSYHYKEKEERL